MFLHTQDENYKPSTSLLLRDFPLAVVDHLLKVLRVLTVDSAADGESGSEHLLDGSDELLGHGLRAHGASDAEQLVLGEVTCFFEKEMVERKGYRK